MNYLNSNHLVLLMPAMLYIVSQNGKLALLAYITAQAMWTRNENLLGGDFLVIEMIYPVTILLLCWYLTGNNQAVTDKKSQVLEQEQELAPSPT